MTDTPSLAQKIAEVLTPALPFLTGQSGGGSAVEAARQLGETAWGLAQQLWGSLRPRVETSPAAQQIVSQVAEDPGATGAQPALAFQLQALIRSDAALSQQLTQILQAAPRASEVVASGTSAVAIGGNATDSLFVTGSNNAVTSNRLDNIRGSQIAFGGGQVNAEAGAVDPQALMAVLAELQAAIGELKLPPSDRLVAQTAAGNAALDGVKDGQVDVDVVKQNVERIGTTLKSANTAIQEGSTLWASVQKLASVLGPLVGGARVVAAWFGVPLPL